jgi:hypothetical protein
VKVKWFKCSPAFMRISLHSGLIEGVKVGWFK